MNNRYFSGLLSPAVLLFVLVILLGFSRGIYSGAGIDPPAVFTVGVTLGFTWVAGWWMRNDCRKLGLKWVFDMGMFLFILWPIILPYHLLKTRRGKGFLVILGFVGVWIFSVVVGAILSAFFF